MKKETKRKLIEWLISLVITLVMLGVVVGLLYLYMYKTQLQFEMKSVWIGNAIGGVITLLIVHHFVKKPKDTNDKP